MGGVRGPLAPPKSVGLVGGDAWAERVRGSNFSGMPLSSANGSGFVSAAGLVGGEVRGSQRFRGVGVSMLRKAAIIDGRPRSTADTRTLPGPAVDVDDARGCRVRDELVGRFARWPFCESISFLRLSPVRNWGAVPIPYQEWMS